MIRNSIKKRITICLLSILIFILLCIIPIDKKYKEEINYNANFNEVYLLNNNDMLVKTSTISYSQDYISKVKEIIEALTINSHRQNYINNNFRPILPENTKLLSVNIDKDILKINFSKELLNISEKLEEKMLETLIYSLTNLDNISKIIIFVEGENLTNLPVSHKKLPPILTRNYGINKIYDITTINDVSSNTIYYYENINNDYYVIPVTLFSNNSDDKVEVIIKSLKSSLAYQTDLVSFLSNNTKLLDYEIEENKIKLNFNNALLDNFYDDKLMEEVKYAIASSIKDSLNINNVEIYVNGVSI